MRLFVGVELDPAVKAAAGGAAAALRETVNQAAPELRASWVAMQSLHITVWFIGEVSDARGDAIAGGLRASCFRQPAFDLVLGGCGVFPPSGPPRVFWIGVRQGAAGMAALHAEVGERLAPLGFVPERRGYTSHLTIARVKAAGRGAAARVVRTVVSEFPAECGVSRVEAVTLFRSRLSPKGATYEPLLRVPLS
jgi:2'-5' RNA ligase